MRRNILHSLGLRVSMLTMFIFVLAAVMPLVALASQGDPDRGVNITETPPRVVRTGLGQRRRRFP